MIEGLGGALIYKCATILLIRVRPTSYLTGTTWGDNQLAGCFVGRLNNGDKKAHNFMGLGVVTGGPEGMPTQTVYAYMTNGLHG